MAENNGVKSRRDQQLERLRKKYPDKKFEDDEEIFGQISDDYDQYEHDLDGYRGREKPCPTCLPQTRGVRSFLPTCTTAKTLCSVL